PAFRARLFAGLGAGPEPFLRRGPSRDRCRWRHEELVRSFGYRLEQWPSPDVYIRPPTPARCEGIRWGESGLDIEQAVAQLLQGKEGQNPLPDGHRRPARILRGLPLGVRT